MPTPHRRSAPVDGDWIDALQKELARAPAGSGTTAPALPLAFSQPLLLMGLVSAAANRREVLRCTWMKAMPAGAARIFFVVGIGAPDANRDDVLPVQIEEQLLARRAGGSGHKIRGVSSYSTYSLYAKTMHFLRFAASQPEPAVVLGDDDIFVQPRALLSYTWVLLSQQRNTSTPLGWGSSGEWYAGRFDWYSWRTEMLQATAYWRAMRGALYGAMAPYRNCSPTGNGWIYGHAANGKTRTALHEAAAMDAGQERCVGPFAFAKGPLAMLSAPVVRWIVASERFAKDTAWAAALANGTLVRGKAVERVPQDVQMGYWLSAHPTLRYVHLPKKTGWADAFVEVTDLRRLLIAHRVPWDQLGWLTRHTTSMWAHAPRAHLQLKCGGPLCPAGQCAHARQQLACAMELLLPSADEYPPSRRHVARAGCENCRCWAHNRSSTRTDTEGRRVFSGGQCNFTRAYAPEIPAHCVTSALD